MKSVTLQLAFVNIVQQLFSFFFNIFLFRLDTEGIELIAKFLQVRCVLWLYVCASLEFQYIPLKKIYIASMVTVRCNLSEACCWVCGGWQIWEEWVLGCML